MFSLLEARRTPPLIGSFLLAALLVASGCQSGGSSSAVSVTPFSVPASAGSGQPYLYAEEGGPVWLSWVEPVGEETHALRYATLRDTSWSDPETAARGTHWFVNWADVPSLRPLPDGRLAAHYLQSNGPRALAYAVRIVQTTRDGSWQSAVTPHNDSTRTEHGFVSLLPWRKHRLLAVWLDGRKMAGGEGHQGEMTLRGAVLDSSGTVEQRALLDGRTCECCPTSAVRVGGKALVAYRDRTENEIRNIKLVRFDGQSWSEPTLLHDDGWKIAGCPVNGPALTARGDRVAAAWFTAAGGTSRVKVAFSTDGGQTFSDPTVVANGETKGRVDAVLLDDGTAVVSWLGQTEEAAHLRARTVKTTGEKGAPFTIASLPAAARGVGMPRLVRGDSYLYAAWTGPEAEKGSNVRLARVSTEALR
ncbi:MAG: hypothetical protein ABEL04_12310 [Salinibacter sp.]|uniref:hypothetical protein n=1 Tax=Salinibacter sp. TaxID=2065818 RepID=UPI0035D51471